MQLITIGLLWLILALILFFERCRRADVALILQDLRAARDETKKDSALIRQELAAAARGEFKTDVRAARDEAKTDYATLRRELKEEMALRAAHTDQQTKNHITALREELALRAAHTDQQIKNLTDAVLKLAGTVGQVKGRTEALTTTP